jgi:integrase
MRHVQPSPTHLRSRAQNPCLHRYHADSFTAKLGDLIFPGARHNPTRDNLPAFGHALRRTFKTIATDHCKVPDDISAMLLGHVPEGMSQRYLLRWARASGPAIVGAQAKISRKIVSLLGT